MSKPPVRPQASSQNTSFQAGGAPATVRLPGMAQGTRAPVMPSQAQRKPTAEEVTQALHRGGALFAIKRFDDAAKIAELILQFEPKQADALHLLGLVRLAQDKPIEAEKLMLKASKTLGKHPVLYVNLGNAARAQRKSDKALKYYGQALQHYALHKDAYVERGILHAEYRRFTEALSDFERALALEPKDFAACSGAAHVAAELGRYQRAIDICEQGMRDMNPPPIELMSMVAVNKERLSQLEEAIEAADKVLEIKPDHGACLRVWAKAHRRLAKRDMEKLKPLREKLEGFEIGKMPAEDARVVYSELAQICEEMNDTDAAFGYFEKQNEATRAMAQVHGVSGQSFVDEVEGLLAQWQPQTLEALSTNAAAMPMGADERVPVFIVGFPRSGTTLLDQILDAHPDVQVLEELPLVRHLINALGDKPEDVVKALTKLRKPQREKLQAGYWRDVEKQGGDLAKKVIIDKLPLNIMQVPVMAAIFPNAKFILALRHPADSCLSCFMQDFEINAAMMNFTSIADTMRAYDLVMSLWQRYASHLKIDVAEVRYENLISDLRGEVEPVLAFLGLQWDEKVSDPAAHARARGTIRTPSYAQVTQPIYGDAADRWRRYASHLTPNLPLLEKHIAHFGYKA
jgi:tetratricopeptide (TPR) repeat protein